jgi:hypothetical protein
MPTRGLGLDRLAHLADLIAPPQHRQHRDGKPGAPGGKERERLKAKIGELNGDLVAGLEANLDEEGGERIDRGVGLAIAVAARAPELERLGVRRIRQSKRLGSLPGAAPEQPFGGERRLLPLSLLIPLRCCERAHHPRGDQCWRGLSPEAEELSGAIHQLSIW